MQPELKAILLSKNEEVRQESINRGVNRCLHRLLNHTQFSSPTGTAPPVSPSLTSTLTQESKFHLSFSYPNAALFSNPKYS